MFEVFVVSRNLFSAAGMFVKHFPLDSKLTVYFSITADWPRKEIKEPNMRLKLEYRTLVGRPNVQ